MTRWPKSSQINTCNRWAWRWIKEMDVEGTDTTFRANRRLTGSYPASMAGFVLWSRHLVRKLNLRRCAF